MALRSACALIIYLLAAASAFAGEYANSSIKVALVQLDVSDVGNFQKFEDLARQAKHEGASSSYSRKPPYLAG